jgi:photosystem II stability/assembly factor-like uncharacterized protein
LLATTAAGLLVSSDDGGSWRTLAPPEPAVLAAWADEQTIVIVTTNGKLASSTDSGANWTLHRTPIGNASALHVRRLDDQRLEIIAVVGDEVVRTTDGADAVDVLVP